MNLDSKLENILSISNNFESKIDNIKKRLEIKEEIYNQLSILRNEYEGDCEILLDGNFKLNITTGRDNSSLNIFEKHIVLEHIDLSEELDCFAFSQVLYFLSAIYSTSNREKNTKITEFEVINFLPMPLCVLNKSNDLILGNTLFKTLSITKKSYSLLKESKTIEIDSNLFQVKMADLDDEHKVFLFLTNAKQFEKYNKKVSLGELGIITSSMAHDLKNPIAGILAAVDYLLIDAEGELNDELLEMKKSGLHCNDLLKIFLGFSKRNINDFESTLTFEETLNKAIDILRMRMVESGIKFSVHLIERALLSNIRSSNNSVITMVSYLILNEVITSVSKWALITNKLEKQLNFQVKVFSRLDSFGFELELPFELEKEIIDSKLIQSLLEMSHLKLKIESGNNFIFEYIEELDVELK